MTTIQIYRDVLTTEQYLAEQAENAANKFVESADAKETSTEIMEAILYTAGGDGTQAERIWGDPTESEMIVIWERVTKNGLNNSSEFFWGAEGNSWASGVETSQPRV